MSQAGTFIGPGTPGLISTLTANSGGPIAPTGNNINLLGDLTTITSAGNAGTSTITFSLLPTATATLNYTNVAATPFFAVLANFYLSVDTSALAITIMLPNSPMLGRYWLVKDRIGNCANLNITVTTIGGIILIDGATSYVMNNNFQSSNFVFNGTSYEVF